MGKYSKICLLLILLIYVLLFLSGCGNSKTNIEETKAKVVQELEYLDTKIVSIASKVNNINLQNYTITSEEVSLGANSTGESSGGKSKGSSGSSSQSENPGEEQKQSSSQSGNGQSKSSNITAIKMEPDPILDIDENNVDWKTIKSEIETISDSWGVVILDLSNLNVDNNDVLGFSSALDDCIVAIKDENKTDTLTNIAKLYSFIPKFEREISSDNSIQNIKQAKSYLLNGYSLVEKGDWTQVNTSIADCESSFRNLINDIEYIKDKEYKVNKTYVLIKELQNSLTYKDKKIFYIKYKNLIESINTL